MKAIEIREKYLEFFRNKNHQVISGAPLVPENDPTVLFTTAGMHPLVPYLTGNKHPLGDRLTDYQKCLRTDDIDEVGDNRHLTFFEMLGNWSLGNYFKEESIKYSYEFLVDVLKIPANKLSVTCFAGDNDAPKDELSAKVWEELGIDKNNIYFFGKKQNWWGMNTGGPCGPDTEIFYDTGKEKCSNECNPDCDCGKYVEIWNNVFMEYNKVDDKYLPLAQKNVDTGLGLERITFLLQSKKDVFETELFTDIIDYIISISKDYNDNSCRIVADHLRASCMLVVDNVKPSNVEQGYILRRLIRRVVRHLRMLDIDVNKLSDIVSVTCDTLSNLYPEIIDKKYMCIFEINKEKNRFMNTLVNGEKEFSKIVKKLKEENISIIDGETVFRLYDTFGFPPELTIELGQENDLDSDIEGFNKCFTEHQDKSRGDTQSKFKGGLADSSEETVKYHTATHLLHESLKRVLGNHVMQKGANITTERLRFDFSNPSKVEKEDLLKVENMINEQITKKIPVILEEMTLEDAKKSGAIGIFDNKYGDRVSVYTIGNFSKEICGGPHVDNTSKLDRIKIVKEEAVSSGVRRIKAVFVKE